MAVYSNTDILQAIKDETIICLPFNKQHVSEASLVRRISLLQAS